MPNKFTRRGFDQDDQKWFSTEAVSKLKTVQEEIQWLLDRGYKQDSVIEFVGNHYLLSSRQRLALQRSTSTSLQYQKRKNNMLPLEDAINGCIHIDGFNLIITLEVALSKSVIILGNDGVMRDLAGLRGTYSLIEQTNIALDLIGRSFKELSAPEAKFYLDAPISNSGRLRSRILQYAVDWNIPVDVELVPNADAILSNMGRIVTSDSILLDRCTSWFNLSRKIVEDYIKDTWVVSFK